MPERGTGRTVLLRPPRSGAGSQCIGTKLRLTAQAEYPLQARQPRPQPARPARRTLRRRRSLRMEKRTIRQGRNQVPTKNKNKLPEEKSHHPLIPADLVQKITVVPNCVV